MEMSLLFQNQEYLYHNHNNIINNNSNNNNKRSKIQVLYLELANVRLIPVFEVDRLWEQKLVPKTGSSKT